MSTTSGDQSAYRATTPPSYGSRVDEASTAYGAPTRTGRNGIGVAALVLGIISIVACFAWYAAGVCAILAIVFGVIGRNRAKRGEATNPGVAKAGLITGIIGLVASIAVMVAVLAFLNSGTGKCIQNAGGNQSVAQQCVK